MTEQRSNVILPYDYDDVLDTILDIGCRLLESGAEVRRVEDTMERLCLAYGAHDVDVFSIVVLAGVTVEGPNGDHYTQIRKIGNISNSLVRIEKLNALSRRICKEKLSCEAIQAELAQIDKCRTYPFWMELIACALIAGAFTLFFGGTWLEAIASFFVGALVKLVLYLTERWLKNKFFTKFVSTFVASTLAFLAVAVGITNDVDKIIIGNIMFLIPGIGFTNALRDLFTGDNVAGLIRSIESVLMALAIAAGYFVCVCTIGGLWV